MVTSSSTMQLAGGLAKIATISTILGIGTGVITSWGSDPDPSRWRITPHEAGDIAVTTTAASVGGALVGLAATLPDIANHATIGGPQRALTIGALCGAALIGGFAMGIMTSKSLKR